MRVHIAKIILLSCCSNRKDHLTPNKPTKTQILTILLVNVKIKLAFIIELHL